MSDTTFDYIGIGIVYDGDVMFVTEQFMDLDDRFKVCRYPHGLKAYSYCTRPTVPGTSYCEDHLRACYTVPPAKARVSNHEVFAEAGKNHEREDA